MIISKKLLAKDKTLQNLCLKPSQVGLVYSFEKITYLESLAELLILGDHYKNGGETKRR